MRLIKSLLIGGAAAAIVAGAAAAADALSRHTLDVRLPDGGVAHVEYYGDVAPRITFDRAAPAWQDAWFGPGLFNGDPFAAFERMRADMDRQMQAMRKQMETIEARALGAGKGGLTMADFGAAPVPGASYSFVSRFSSDGACTRRVEITQTADGGPPKVVSQTSGACAAETPRADEAIAMPAEPANRTTPAKAETPLAKPAKPAV